jgi:hypothetical protein
LDEKVVRQQAALAVEQDGLEELCGHYTEEGELVDAAKTK